MTTPADDVASERAFEALLGGRAVPAEAAGLAAFTGAVRASATQPGRPNAALAELLATGLLTDQSSPSARTAVAAGPLPSRRARIRRRRFAMIFPALLAKFLSASALAQAATGATVVVVAVTGAGATGALGEDVQDGLTSVIAAGDGAGDPAIASPTGDPATVTGPGVVPTPAETTALVIPTATGIDAAAFVADGPAGFASFGDWVSTCAADPRLRAELRAEGISFGQVVRTWAHKKGKTEADLADDGVNLDDLDDDAATATATATATPTAVPEVETADAGETSRGKSNGNGNGNGNGGGQGEGRSDGGHGKH